MTRSRYLIIFGVMRWSAFGRYLGAENRGRIVPQSVTKEKIALLRQLPMKLETAIVRGYLATMPIILGNDAFN